MIHRPSCQAHPQSAYCCGGCDSDPCPLGPWPWWLAVVPHTSPTAVPDCAARPRARYQALRRTSSPSGANEKVLFKTVLAIIRMELYCASNKVK